MIRRDATTHEALKEAGQGEVVFHSGYSGHPRGFAWRSGGEVPQEKQLALSTLAVVHLIGLVPARIADGYGSEVPLTPEGQRVLSEWDKAVAE